MCEPGGELWRRIRDDCLRAQAEIRRIHDIIMYKRRWAVMINMRVRGEYGEDAEGMEARGKRNAR